MKKISSVLDELDDVSDLTIIAQLAITCSKLITETLEKGVKYVQS